METPSTVLILAAPPTPQAAPHSADDDWSLRLHSVASLVLRARDSRLPTVLVAPSALLNATRQWTTDMDVVTVALECSPPGETLSSGLRLGVQVSATAEGWIMLPLGMSMLQPGTLNRISELLTQHLIAYPTHHSRQGLPIGFGRELFSELIQVRSDRDLHRLINRYPSQGIELDDPGVLMHPWLDEEGPAPIGLRPQAALQMHK
ncbi:NTP transferase domain-containing protein [Aquabacterium sp.]|uniref:NTP transferase domain-containing protein n=1 Tax=Aquabacterium sp. TaxID=1872578 RepID=UPI0035C67223